MQIFIFTKTHSTLSLSKSQLQVVCLVESEATEVLYYQVGDDHYYEDLESGQVFP